MTIELIGGCFIGVFFLALLGALWKNRNGNDDG